MLRYILALLLLAGAANAGPGIWVTAPASGGVTNGANLTADAIVIGDDGAAGVKSATITITGDDDMNFPDGAKLNWGSVPDFLVFDEAAGTLCIGGFATTCLDMDNFIAEMNTFTGGTFNVNTAIIPDDDDGAESGSSAKGWSAVAWAERSFPKTIASTQPGDTWLPDSSPAGTPQTVNVIPQRLHEWDSTTSQWEPLRGPTWADADFETVTIGNAVGDWPDCTTGGTEDKTDPGSITDFSSFTGWDTSKRFVLVKTAFPQNGVGNTTFRHLLPSDSATDPALAGTHALYGNGGQSLSASDRGGGNLLFIDSSGRANVWCSAATVLDGSSAVSVQAFW